MRLLKYSEFILEARGDIKCPVVLSESFIKKCRKIDSPISKELIRMDGEMSSYVFINDNLDGDTIQYSEAERVIDFLKKKYEKSNYFDPILYLKGIDIPDPDDDLWNKNRIDIKVGRFVRRFLGSKWSDSQIEDFVNKWKSLKDKPVRFEFWTGDKIIDGYKSELYVRSGYNPLTNSCMNNRSDLVDFYTYVPNIKLVVLLNEDDEIEGRALLWTDVEGRLFLDRVYYANDSDYYRFVNLAKENGWFYKKTNGIGPSIWMLNGQDQDLGDVKVNFPLKTLNMLKMIELMFPYLDTFQYLDDVNGYLMTDKPKGTYYQLNGTDGEYEYYTTLVDIYGFPIQNEDEYVTSETQGGLINYYKAIHVEYDGFDDYIEQNYLNNPKNGFVYDKEEDQWYKKEDYEKIKFGK